MSASTEKKIRQAAKENGTDKKAAAAKAEAEKKAKSIRRVSVSGIVLLVLLVTVLYINSGVFCRQATAVTVGDAKYSAADVSYAYGNQYYYFANQYGLNESYSRASFVNQAYSGDKTWKDYFVDTAVQGFAQNEALCDYAEENGITLSEADLASIADEMASIAEAAKAAGALSANAYLTNAYGKGVNAKVVEDMAKKSSLAQNAYSKLGETFQYTDSELAEQYKSYNGNYDTFDFVSFLVPADKVTTTGEDGTQSEAVNEETLAKAEAMAKEIVDAYKDAEGEDALSKLSAAVASVIPGETAQEQSAMGASLDAYKEWMVDASRKAGDITYVQNNTADGYYVVVFGSRDDNGYNMAQVRHILVKAEADETGAYTDEAKAAAKAKAEDILAEYMSGDNTEESFAALAEKYSEDAGSNTNGGLYDTVAKGQMVPEFDAFCFEGHKTGDTAVVYGESSSYAGYHVMYYVGEGELYSNYIAKSGLLSKDISAKLEEMAAAKEVKYGYWMRVVS